jgi:hypothetical protein
MLLQGYHKGAMSTRTGGLKIASFKVLSVRVVQPDTLDLSKHTLLNSAKAAREALDQVQGDTVVLMKRSLVTELLGASNTTNTAVTPL